MENTTENNKLIVEFMGYKPHRTEAFYGKINTIDKSIENPSYHNSWDWLMPVVEKIESLNFVVIIKQSHVSILNNSKSSPYGSPHFVEKKKIESTYKAIIHFIKWYNENK